MTCPIPDLAYLPLLSVFTFLPNSRCVLSSVASSVGRGSLLCHGFLHFCLFQGNPSKGKSYPEKKHLNAAPHLIPNGRQNDCLQLHKGSKITLSLHKPQTGRHVGYLFFKNSDAFSFKFVLFWIVRLKYARHLSYNPKKNALNPVVKENYLNSFRYADFFASRGGSKRLQTKKEPGKRSKNVYRAPFKPLVIYYVAVTKCRLSFAS